jgi:prepilin-type N-terminal cleavage/methylation domain-containing protein
MFRRNPRPRAFTLVELLVVIGIIALLISVLMPALNRARQAANLIDCQARLRQMGQAMHIYVGSNKNALPWGGINFGLANPSSKIPFWWWQFTLSEVMNRNTVGQDGTITNLSPIFRDRDTIENPGGAWVNHYTCNPRVFYRADVPDPAPFYFGGAILAPNKYTNRKITSVKQATSVFVLWDGPQLFDQAYNAYAIAEAIDSWGYYNNGLCYGANVPVSLDLGILPGQGGQSGSGDGRAAQRQFNADAVNAFGGTGWQSHLRFRHMGNTTLAALCLDGHIETRRVGTVLRQDIFTNYR